MSTSINMLQKEHTISLLLRVGLAFAFIYPAVAAFFDPFSWIGFFPEFIRDVFPGDDTLLLHFFGATEIIIALWLLIGRNVFIPSIIAAIYLLAIVLFNLSLLDLVFRDISILAMALALALMEHGKNKTTSPPPHYTSPTQN